MKLKFIFLDKVLILCIIMVLYFFNINTCAQIIYSDIPDATPNATYPLDLNNDSIVDFLIQFNSTNSLMCIPQNNNAYSGNFNGILHLPWALSASVNICDTLSSWYDSNNPGTMAWETNAGNWVGVTDKYLALKLVDGNNTYFGWARLDVLATSSSFTIKDYAYQSSPNTCILSGKNGLVNNEDLIKNSFSIFPNPFNYSTTINILGEIKKANLTIYNSYGQILKQIKNVSSQSVSLSRDHLSSGLYFIKLTDENKIFKTEKFIIKD